MVGVSGDGSSLAVFSADSDPPVASKAALPADIRGGTGAVSGVADLAGADGGVLELRQGDGGSVAVTLSSGKAGGKTCVVSGLDGARDARSCAQREEGGGKGGCALAGGVSASGKTFVASASLLEGHTCCSSHKGTEKCLSKPEAFELSEIFIVCVPSAICFARGAICRVRCIR